jgi:transposase
MQVCRRKSAGKPTTRRYSSEEKAAAVRMVRALRAELGTEQGTVQRVARQLGYGVESVRMWVRQADIDEGLAPGVSTAESARVKELAQENRELKRANGHFEASGQFLRGGARPPTQEIVDFIDDNREEFGVEPICTVLRPAGVSVAPSPYYDYAAKYRRSFPRPVGTKARQRRDIVARRVNLWRKDVLVW